MSTEHTFSGFPPLFDLVSTERTMPTLYCDVSTIVVCCRYVVVGFILRLAWVARRGCLHGWRQRPQWQWLAADFLFFGCVL
jgi:hypothetical protein